MKVDTLARQILFCTVHVTNVMTDGKVSTGTGFLFDATTTEDGNRIPLLISNKHVLEKASEIRLNFLIQNADNSGPELGRSYRYTIVGAPVVGIVGHPDPAVDIAVLPIAKVWDDLYAQTPPPFWRTLSWSNLPTEQAMSVFDAIEDLTFVGYPKGLSDPTNHLPIVRRAITATPIAVPFGGTPTFLLDGAVFGGSSGSPVFILNRGTFTMADGSLSVGSRFFLVGIVAQSYNQTEDIPVQMTAAAPFVHTSQALNLGVAFSSRAIVETINHTLSIFGAPEGKALQDHQ
ncbi:S1 family peptidase [Mycolicibacterium sp. CBM1]